MQTATISKAMIKFWSKFHFKILWYSFTWDNRYLLTPSVISHRKILPPAPLDISAIALVCIFSPILNSMMERWKCRSRERLKAIFVTNLKQKKKESIFLKFKWNFFQTRKPSGQDQQNGKRTYCRLPSQSFRINFKDTSSHISMDS